MKTWIQSVLMGCYCFITLNTFAQRIAVEDKAIILKQGLSDSTLFADVFIDLGEFEWRKTKRAVEDSYYLYPLVDKSKKVVGVVLYSPSSGSVFGDKMEEYQTFAGQDEIILNPLIDAGEIAENLNQILREKFEASGYFSELELGQDLPVFVVNTNVEVGLVDIIKQFYWVLLLLLVVIGFKLLKGRLSKRKL